MSDQSMALIKRTLNSTEIMTRFASLMGERQATYYINSVILAVANNKDLQECTPNSIVFSALRAASLKLSCDPALGEAYMVPFKNGRTGDKEAVFIPGYKGLRNMATRTNKYRYINAGKLRNGEQWIEDQLTGKCSIAGKAIDNTKIGWFAFFEMYSGYSKGLFMTTEEIHDHAAKFSKTYNSANSKWKTDPESMEKKTILRLLLVRWGDLGEAGNAFVEDEIIDGDFHVSLEAHDEDSGNGHHDKEQVLHDLYGDPIPPEHDGEPPIEQNGTATETPAPETVAQSRWSDELVQHIIKCNLGVKDADKVPAMFDRSKMLDTAAPRRHFELWTNWYCQARKGSKTVASKSEDDAAEDADSKLANVISAEK